MGIFLFALIVPISLILGKPDDDGQSLFPYLNITSIMIFDENGQPITGFFTQPPEGKSAADVERRMKEISYTVFTRDKPEGWSVEDAVELKNTTFDPNKNTKFITHGWRSNGKSDTCMEIKNGYLKNYDVNVIIMDWGDIARDIFYVNPMRSVPRIAHHYAILINDMINILGVDPKNIHLIGHSLGAQVSGLVWKDMEDKKPGRVTGLDPAYPGFHQVIDKNDRISDESADFVDVIHSCGGILGILEPVGHVDFYPNGGTAMQPGCSEKNLFFQLIEACSHGRSWKYFAESVEYPEKKFIAMRCKDWHHFTIHNCDKDDKTAMGEEVRLTARGSYFLRTGSRTPFMLFEEN